MQAAKCAYHCAALPHIGRLLPPHILNRVCCGPEWRALWVPQPPVGRVQHPHRERVGRVPLVELVHEVMLHCMHDVLALLVGYEPDVDLWCGVGVGWGSGGTNKVMGSVIQKPVRAGGVCLAEVKRACWASFAYRTRA